MIHRNGVYTEYRSSEDVSQDSKSLEKNGYVVLRQVFSPAEVTELAGDIDRVFNEYPPAGRSGARSDQEDEEFRYEMLNVSAAAQRAVAHPGILNVIEPLIGEDCHVIANTAWRNEPTTAWSHGGGGWHIDAGPHVPLPKDTEWPAGLPHPVFAIGTHIFLEDCNIEDGPTAVIPNSHLSGRFPPARHYHDPDLTWRGNSAVPLIAKAGDVAMFVSDIWHRRLPTGEGDQGRYFLQVHYGRRDIAQRLRPTAEINHLSEAALARARTEREKTLVGLHNNRFYDG